MKDPRKPLMRLRSTRAVALAGLGLALFLAPAIILASDFGPSSAKAWEGDAVVEQSSWAGMALGIYRPELPNNLSAVEEYEAGSGQQMSIVHWYAIWGGWKSEFSRSDLETVAARGSLPFISWEPWAARGPEPDWSLRNAILSGRHDAYIESWARGLAEYGRPVLFRFAHEMHHQPHYPWAVGVNGNTAEEYVAAWRHVHRIFEAAGASNVLWVWNPNTMGDTPASVYEPVYRALYPGDDYVDWLGLDIYNTGPHLDWGAPRWRSFDEALSQPYAAITAVSAKPLVLPEVGSPESGGSKAAWIAEALRDDLQVRYPQLRALVWFDVYKEEAWALRSSPAALEAWSSAARQPFFSVDPYSTLELPSES